MGIMGENKGKSLEVSSITLFWVYSRATYGVLTRLAFQHKGVLRSMGFLSCGRSGLVMSTGSSLRPLSTISNHSGILTTSGNGMSISTHSTHNNGSGCSVRWVEEGLKMVRKTMRREWAERAKDNKKDDKKSRKDGKKGYESTTPLEGRTHTAITDIFPNVRSRRASASDEAGSRRSLFSKQLPADFYWCLF